LVQREQERREYFRLKFNTALQFKAYDTILGNHPRSTAPQRSLSGSTQNISQCGVLFQTEQTPPKLSSIVWMNLDMRTLKICQEIESKALIFNNGVLGKVVRVEEDVDNSNAYDVGVIFLNKNDKDSRVVQEILEELSKTAA